MSDYSSGILRGVHILDCTLRDGALCCDSQFPDMFPESLVCALSASGVDVVELGFKSTDKNFPKSKFGSLRFCDDEYLYEHFAKLKGNLKFAAMIDVLSSDMYGRIPFRKEAGVVDILRVCAYYKNLSEMVDLLAEAKSKGYETAACLMAVSTLPDSNIDAALDTLCSSSADIIYLMDSFGALLPQRALSLLQRYSFAAHSAGRLAGAHFHDNMQLAFANSLSAAIAGVDIIDSSVGGMGKGAGNCRTEAILSAKFSIEKIRPIMVFIQNYLNPFRERFSWGYRPEYAISALKNINSKVATAFIKENSVGSFPRPADFYDSLFAR